MEKDKMLLSRGTSEKVEEETDSSHGEILWDRVQMIGTGMIPKEFFDKDKILWTFLEVADPDEWPPEMKELRDYLDKTYPPL